MAETGRLPDRGLAVIGPETGDISEPAAGTWRRLFVKTGGVTVVHVDLAPHPLRQADALGWLDERELGRWRRYLFPGPRHRFALCRAALRSLLCDRLGCDNADLTFGESRYGKPLATVRGKAANISFNVSHSVNHGLIALAKQGRLGIDVEEIVPKRHLDGLIEAAMGPQEQAELAAAPESEKLRRFYRYWTCKEALIKALGTGFSTDIARFQTPLNIRRGETTGVFRFPHLPEVEWRLEDIGGEDFAAALAHELEPYADSALDSDSQG